MQPGDVLLVVHDFDARSTDELTLRKGDKIELVELDDGFGDGWYLGRHVTGGGTGLFPGVYTTKVPPGFGRQSAVGSAVRTSLPGQPALLQSTSTAQHGKSTQSPPVNQSYAPSATKTPAASLSEPFSQPVSPTGVSDMSKTQPMISQLHLSQSGYPRSIGQALSDPHGNRDSPVMNETLNVIDEHMQDMSTPRHSVITRKQRLVDDSESDYSSHLNDRQSFVAGPETDEEDSGRLTEAEVKTWDHKQTAGYLRSIGVDSKHCDIFQEQEISGDVLLDMDQSFIYMKEYDFGVMGRRLKTWHKIRDLQEEVRGVKMSRQTSTAISVAESAESLPQAHTRVGSSGAAILPRIPDLSEQQGLAYRSHPPAGSFLDHAPQPLQTQPNALKRTSMHASTPPSPWRASMAPDSPSRPSAALIRDISHSRRHSSIDFIGQPSFDHPTSTSSTGLSQHKKQASMDHAWSMNSSTPLTSITTPSTRQYALKQQSTNGSIERSIPTEPSSVDLDRGYFSGNELDNRKSRNVLRKRESQASAGHSRHSSIMEDPMRSVPVAKKHSRLSSVDSIREISPKVTSSAAKAYHSRFNKGRIRSASARTPSPLLHTSALSPTVTNLESGQVQTSPQPGGNSPLSPTTQKFSGKTRKIMGLRAISDAVTGNERTIATSPVQLHPDSPMDSPTGTNTPSGTSRSFEMENAEADAKSADVLGSTLALKASNGARPKTKHQTSAYLRGLQKITPAEARKNADYSGWMKKKSSSLLATWKPRLFILRGRRLSYYYSESDSAERGIIDISGHKVLVANSDSITTLHATITGATSSSAPGSAPVSAETSPVVTKSPTELSAPFFFKLVPPKAGLSRAVQFTKPTVHYFQVDGLVVGRRWMGEMMKATIEHDLTAFETTNKQKTISLAKARARRERPPDLKETVRAVEEPTQENNENGLKIQGLSFEKKRADARSSFEGMFDDKGDVVRDYPLPDTGPNAR